MTVVYNATWWTCFIDFKQQLKNIGIDYYKLEESQKQYYRGIHRAFYNYIKSPEFLITLFKGSSCNMREFKYITKTVTERKEVKVNYRGERDKYIFKKYAEAPNNKKTRIATKANNLHYLDSTLVRLVLSRMDAITIHDCFGVRSGELHILMDLINDYYKEHHKSCAYGLFVVK